MLHTVARFTPVEWVLLDACDLAGNPTEVYLNLYLYLYLYLYFYL